MGKSALSAILSKLFLACAGIFGGLLFVELALAVFSPQPDFYFFEYADGGYIFHKRNFNNLIAEVPNGGTAVTVGGQKVINKARQYVMLLRTNNAGFRNDENASYEKTHGTYRILHLGDSLGFGFPLAKEETYTALIENFIPKSEVLNGSTVFTHTARLLDYYQKEGYKYDPDMVIAQLTISHPNEDYLYLDMFGKSRFELSALKELGGRDTAQIFISKDEAGLEQLSWIYTDTKRWFDVLNQKLDRGSFLYHELHIARFLNSVSDFLKMPVATIIRGYRTEIGPLTKSYQKISGYAPQSFSVPMPFRPEVNIRDIDIKFTRAYLNSFKDALAAKNKKFVIAFIPNRFGCAGATYPLWEKLLGELLQNGYYVVNFYHDFCDAASGSAKEEFYLSEEFHLNAAGHKLIAERLAAEILKIKDK